MASTTTISSSSYSPFETSNSNSNTNNLRDDSFSSYLALIRQSFSTDLAANPNSRRSSFQTIAGRNSSSSRRLSKDIGGEIDVFAAEKYFRGTLDDNALQDYPADSAPSSENTTVKKSEKKSSAFSSRKSRSSTCSDTSVNSNSVLLHNRRPPSSHGQLLPHQQRRRSTLLDLFRCSCSKQKDITVDEEDVERRFPGTIKKGFLQSDSSSDLFEIESTSMNPSLPAVIYEPSEASIEWSVVTRSAVDLSGEGVGRARRSSTSGILRFGCVSEKAVLEKADISITGESKVGSLERYHVMMDLGPSGVAGMAKGRQRRASLS